MRDSMERGTARQRFESDLTRARVAAVSSGGRVVFEIGGGGIFYRAGVDEFPYAFPNAIETQLFRTVLPNGITLSASGRIVFDSRV